MSSDGHAVEPGLRDSWDVFVSYASEDEAELAVPLTRELEARGLYVWRDHEQIELGDNLRSKVNVGIAGSRFAVVMLSRSYIEKKWTLDELDAFMAREELGRQVVLPVLHDVERATLWARYPLLANRIFADTAAGIGVVADAIAKVVLKEGSESPSQLSPTLGRRLLDLLERDPEPAEIRQFLSHYPAIVASAAGGGETSLTRWSPTLGDFAPDVCVSTLMPTTGRREWDVIVFDTLQQPLFDASSQPVRSIQQALAALESLRGWIGKNYDAARELLPDVRPSFNATVLAGRRNDLDPSDRQQLESLNDALVGGRVRTYDWLVEAALRL
jgi:hypothetical protein